MAENLKTDSSILDDIVASVTKRLVDEDEAKLIAKLMKNVLHGGAAVEDLTRYRSFDAAKLEDLVQAARTELQRRKSGTEGAAASSRPQNSESRDDTAVDDIENQPATHKRVSPSPRMKKMLAAKRRSQIVTATTEPGSDAVAYKSVPSPDLLEWLEPQPTSSARNNLEQKSRGRSLADEAGRHTDDAGGRNSLTVASRASASDVSSGISDVANYCDKAMDKEMLKEYGFAEIYIRVEDNLHALVGDPNVLVYDEAQQDDIIEVDHPPENQHREVDHTVSSSDTLEGHSGTGFQIAATAPPAMPLKYTKDDAAGTYTCDYCHCGLYSVEDLAFHYTAQHAPADRAYRCEMCAAHCKDQESLARHMRRKHATAVRKMKKIEAPRYEAFAAELPAFQTGTASGN